MMELPSGIPLTVFENNPSACYMLGADLEITYCNPAWDRFAAENGGASLAAQSVLYRPVLQFFTTVMRDYYAGLFALARETGEMQCQEYECSSPEIFRSFQMQIYPLKNGLAIVNSLHAKRAHAQEGSQPFDAVIFSQTGSCACVPTAAAPAAMMNLGNGTGYPEIWARVSKIPLTESALSA
jgi:hypothetical protein